MGAGMSPKVVHAVLVHTPPHGRKRWVSLVEAPNDARSILEVRLVFERREGQAFDQFIGMPAFALDDLIAALQELRRVAIETRGPEAVKSRPLARAPERRPVVSLGERPRFGDDGGDR